MEVKIGFKKGEWYVVKEGDNKVFILQTKRSAFRKAEEMLTEAIQPEEGK